jgi:hypothetical protein
MRYKIGGVEWDKSVTRSDNTGYLEADFNLVKFLYQEGVAKKFFDAVDEKVMPKALEDIQYILEKGWAIGIPDRWTTAEDIRNISPLGFFHFHILGERGLAISGKKKDLEEDLEKVLSPTNVSLSYHTREFTEESGKPEHNILSTLTSKPHTIDPAEYVEKDCAVNHIDLDKNHYAQINFKKTSSLERTNGTDHDYQPRYLLRDGMELDVKGVLLVSLIHKSLLEIDPIRRYKYLKDAFERKMREMDRSIAASGMLSVGYSLKNPRKEPSNSNAT